MFKQSLLLKSSNINFYSDTSNDFKSLISSGLFVKGPHTMKLLYFNCDPRIELFGNTNNTLLVEIKEDDMCVTHTIVVDFCVDIRTDNDLANEIQEALNEHDWGDYPITFLVTNVIFENIMTSAIPEEEMITVVYTIIPSLPCIISFDHKDSIGPIIGMGTGRFCDSRIVEGCRTHSITQYKLIQTYNQSGNAIFNSEDPEPEPEVNPNLDHECCCEIPSVDELDCGIGFHDGYDKGWNDKTNNIPFAVTYLHLYNCEWENQHYNYGWVFGYLLGYQDKTLNLVYRNNYNCNIFEDCGIKDRIKGYARGYRAGRDAYNCNIPFHLDFQHYYKHTCTNSNYNFAFNIGFYTGYNDAENKLFDTCYDEETTGSHNKGSHKAKSHITNKSGKKIGYYRHGGSHNCRDNDEHFVNYICTHNGSHKCNDAYTGDHVKIGSKHNGSHDCRGSYQNHYFIGSNHGNSYNGALVNCNHNGSHICDHKYTGKKKPHNGHSHHGSHNCNDSNHNGSYHNNEECGHNGSHLCGSHYKGCRKPHGSKHGGSHNCKGSRVNSHYKGSNHHGSYNCHHNGSHKCKGSDNVLFRRMPIDKCGDGDCCPEPVDCGITNGFPGNGDNGCPPLEPVWTSYGDINCKMMLYDSNNDIIPNISYPGFDTTISLHPKTMDTWNYDHIQKFLRDLQIEMNRYKTKFIPYAKFELTYDYVERKVHIKNKTGARFGIGFNFLKDGNFITTGSLHKILGFEQTEYLGLNEYISVYKTLIFDLTYSDDHILICADLIRKDQDNNVDVIGLGNPNYIDMNNVLYAIPLSQCKEFRPINSLDSYIDLSESKFMTDLCGLDTFKDICGHDCKMDIPIEVNFYIRLMSGRHLKLNSNWTATLKVEFFPVRSS